MMPDSLLQIESSMLCQAFILDIGQISGNVILQFCASPSRLSHLFILWMGAKISPNCFVYVDVSLQASSLTNRSFLVLRSKRFQPELSPHNRFLFFRYALCWRRDGRTACAKCVFALESTHVLSHRDKSNEILL